jgi:hypothetical protein
VVVVVVAVAVAVSSCARAEELNLIDHDYDREFRLTKHYLLVVFFVVFHHISHNGVFVWLVEV